MFFLLGNVAMVGALIATVSRSARQALEEKIEEQLRLEARAVSREIEEELRLKWTFMESLARNTFMINSVVDVTGRGDYLEPFMQRLELPGQGATKGDLWLLDFAGRPIARSGPHPLHSTHAPAFAQEAWWPEVQGERPVARVLQRDGRARLLFAFPLRYGQHMEGAVVSEFDISPLSELTRRAGLKAALLTAEGPLFGALSPEALRQVRALPDLFRQRTLFPLGDTLYLVEPMEGFTQEKGLRWSLVLSIPTERISGPLRTLAWRMVGTGTLLAALFTALVVWGMRSLLRPLRRIQGTMRGIVDGGDLSQRIRLQSRDELGSIASTFDQMLERLEHRTAELERSRDQLSLMAHITSTAPSAIAMVDLRGHVAVWNQAARQLFGWSQEELSTRPFLEEVVPPDARAAVAQLSARADAGGPGEAEVSLRTRLAGLVPVQLTVTRIADVAGQPMGYVFVMRDLREVKRLRESLVQSEKMAAMGTLVAGLSHELNNPLGIILGFAQGLARRTMLDEASRAAVTAIERQAQRCAQLVRALLDYSRKKVVYRECVPVRALLERVSELVGGQARRANIHFELVLPSEPLPALEVSVQEIESALLNLITNALDATPSGGSVTVSARPGGPTGGVELDVVDTGSGMTEEVLQRAFDPFFTTKPVGQGTGLGLSITRNIVEAHGGSIDVKTSPGAGTTVRLWLPAAGAPSQAQPMEATAWK
jgi:PAS domain S-box-containing protein